MEKFRLFLTILLYNSFAFGITVEKSNSTLNYETIITEQHVGITSKSSPKPEDTTTTDFFDSYAVFDEDFFETNDAKEDSGEAKGLAVITDNVESKTKTLSKSKNATEGQSLTLPKIIGVFGKVFSVLWKRNFEYLQNISSHNSANQTYPYEHQASAGSFPNKYFFLFLVTIVVFAIIVAMCLCANPPKIVCYLCEKPVKEEQWTDGSHRKACFKKNSALVKDFSMIRCLGCYNCGKSLRLWPANKGPPFLCDNLAWCSLAGEEIINTGGNRFNCFLCDFDICLGCAQGTMEKAGEWPFVEAGEESITENIAADEHDANQSAPLIQKAKRHHHQDNSVLHKKFCKSCN